ncbi:hypothetical protein [Serratia ureilytica]|uniref:hypothetical protein n=1 Tax=Serratia ureilytica TaxID=300181 RepID=UPI001651451D|nr:hypothetical protein [Serratia ureilytica]
MFYTMINKETLPLHVADESAAINLMDSFLNIIRSIISVRNDVHIENITDILSQAILEGKSIHQIFNRGPHRDKILYLRKLASNMHIDHELFLPNHNEDEQWLSARCSQAEHARDYKYIMLYYLNGLLISFPNEKNNFSLSKVMLTLCDIYDNKRELGEIDNVMISKNTKININEIIKSSPSLIPELYKKDYNTYAELFRNIRFLETAKLGIEAFKNDSESLKNIFSCLISIDSAIRKWRDSDSINPTFGIKITPEHEGRKNLCKFKDDIDGKEYIFDSHARFTPNDGRIHFLYKSKSDKCVIAYIGRKLN